MKATTLSAALAVALLTAGASPSASAKEDHLKYLRVCDQSACYHAWNVVDSDGDGYNDADEIVAGTDPYNPVSRPDMRVVVELIGKQLLPTFEFGVGKMVVNPAELHAALEEYGLGGGVESPLAAFPLGERKDALTRMGLDVEQLAGFGLDFENDGLTLVRGFDQKKEIPVRRVGGVTLDMISNEDPAGDTPLPEETNFEYEKFQDGSDFYRFENGDEVLITPDGKVERTNKEGKVIYTGYVNPDADTGTEPTKEQFAAWERVRNATVRTVFGWTPVEVGDPDDIKDRKDTIIYINPEMADFQGTVSGAPDFNRAQPETRPDLVSPIVAGGGCWPKCGGGGGGY